MNDSKIILLMGILCFTSLFAKADVIQAKKGTFCPTNQHSTILDGKYVERIFIAAQGVRNDGFIHVYADGERIHRIGIPGYDPDYTFRVRRNVQEIKLTFEGTCAQLFDYKIFTPKEETNSYPRYNPNDVLNGSWGRSVQEIISSLEDEMVDDNLIVHPIFTHVLSKLKTYAMYTNASELVRNNRSIVKSYRALRMVEIIQDNNKLLLNYLMNQDYDHVVNDLLAISEDILEHTDVRPFEIKEVLSELKSDLAQE